MERSRSLSGSLGRAECEQRWDGNKELSYLLTTQTTPNNTKHPLQPPSTTLLTASLRAGLRPTWMMIDEVGEWLPCDKQSEGIVQDALCLLLSFCRHIFLITYLIRTPDDHYWSSTTHDQGRRLHLVMGDRTILEQGTHSELLRHENAAIVTAITRSQRLR